MTTETVTNTTSYEGAPLSEQLLESARRNNLELLNEIADAKSEKPMEFLELFNSTTDGLGNNGLHISSMYGSYEVMDLLLDVIHNCVEECYGSEAETKIKEILNKKNRLDGNTALHLAVLYSISENDPEFGEFIIVEVLMKCEVDVSIRNSKGDKAVDLITDELVEKAEDEDKILWDKIRMELLAAEFSIGLDVGTEGVDVEDDESFDEDE